MSTTIEAYVMLGIEVTRSSFFKDTGSMRRCLGGHTEHRDNAKFCDKCGQPIKTVPIEEPTPEFATLAKVHEKSPDRLWDRLTDFDGIDIGDNTDRLCIRHVGLVSDGESPSMVLGFEVLTQQGDRDRNKVVPNATELSRLADLQSWLEGYAAELNLEGPVKLVLSMSWC